MYLRLLLLILAVLPFSTQLQGGMWDSLMETFRGPARPKAPLIQVLIVHDVPKADLEVNGKYSLFDPYTKSFISSRFSGKRRVLEAMSDGLKWGEAFPGLYQLKIRPDHPATVMVVEGKNYKGNLFVYDIGQSISIVDQIGVEDYVKSILDDYDRYHLEPEALAAAAIAARTNAYYQAVNPKNTYWSVDASKVGFKGDIEVSQAINQAVKETRYMIISPKDSYEGATTPIATQFSNGPVPPTKEAVVSTISLEEMNKMAENGDHAAKILRKAYPGTTIKLLEYSN